MKNVLPLSRPLIIACLAVAALAGADPKGPLTTSGASEKLNYATSLSGTPNIVVNGQVRLSVTASAICGPPDYSCSYGGTDPKPLCTDCSLPPVPDMSARPDAVWYDKVFGISRDGNQVVRCTYPETTQNNNSGYGIGFGGS